MEFINGIIAWFNFYFPIVFVGVLLYVVVMLGSKNWKRYDVTTNRSFTNQEEMIKILKEIRDLLKK